MDKDNNKTKKSQVTTKNSNVPKEEFLEHYTKTNFWDDHKKNTDYLSNLYLTSNKSHISRLGERTKTCSEFLTYANRLDLKTGELVKKLTNAVFCRVRLCPVCQWRRSLMWQSRFYDAIPQIMTKYPNYRFLFLTLTVKNCAVSDLSKTLEMMNKSFRKMLKYKRLEGIFEGWLKTTEITRNKETNEAHPHFHLLIIVKPSYFKKNYIRQFEFIELWQRALKVDYLPNVDIRTVKNKHNNKEDLETAVSELLKYSVKESDLLADKDFLFALTDEIDRKRFISSGGILKDILKVDREDTESLLSDDELDAIEQEEIQEDAIVFKFNRDYKKYAKRHIYTSDDGLLGDQYGRRKRIENAQKKQQRLDEQKNKEKRDAEVEKIKVVDVELEGGELWQALQ